MMYWDGGWGGGWAWMAFMPLLWIALIGLAVWAVIRLTHSPSGGHPDGSRGREGWASREHRETPEEILDRRYAAGEIDADAYTEARERLAAHKPRPR
ncbi:SHOCT domain-containing protein [Streptomyces sp. NPDC001450]